jgi:AcrR family transcriptional regulator
MAAVRAAATTLFATHGPASVSVRDIAAAAGVNHALVHRHFGSKQEVLRAVLEQAGHEMAAIVETLPTVHAGLDALLTASVEREMYWRTLARAILDGENPQGLQRDFPTIRQLIALLDKERQQTGPETEASSPASLDARVVIGTLSALMLGWVVFEPYLLHATGLEKDERQQVRAQVAQMLHRMIDGTR